MFIWIGCKLPGDFEKAIRQRCLLLNKEIGLDTAAFSLPQHISLKISFATDRPEEVLRDLGNYLSSQQAFSVTLHAPEQMGNILWMPVGPHPALHRLHQELDSMLEAHFGIPQHAFDQDFRFHSTLFIDGNHEKIAQMKSQLGSIDFPKELMVNTFLLGASKDGTPGSYRVFQEIAV